MADVMFDPLLWMLIGHAIADYPLQGDWLARAKDSRHRLVPGETIWPLALVSHAAIHAGAVKLATGSWLLAACEFWAHALIDRAKCRGHLTYNGDQIAHLLCKVLWWLVLLGGRA